MPATETPPRTLFPVLGAFVLWARETTRHKWRAVGSADTAPEALALMDASGIHNGDWMLKDDGRDPNDKPEERP